MGNVTKLLGVGLVLLLLSNCKILREFPEKTMEAAAYHSTDISQGAIEGAIRGLNSPNTQLSLQEVLEELVYELNFQLAEIDLEQIDVEVVGDKLVLGFSDALQDRGHIIGEGISGAISKINTESLFENLNSQNNRENLGDLFGSIFSSESGNGQRLGEMMNIAIQEIDLSPLGYQLKYGIDIEELLEPTLETVTSTGQEIGKLAAISDVIRRGQDSYDNDLWKLGTLILILFIIIKFIDYFIENMRNRWHNYKNKAQKNVPNHTVTSQNRLTKEEEKQLISLLARLK